MINKDVPSSFRDPSGYLFYKDGLIYRRINLIYKDNYEHLINSGLYEDLVASGLLILHEEANIECEGINNAFKVIKPELIPFISYPYEWCFSQLKDAALLTLKIQKKALDYGITLKDCSAYNIQFIRGKPVLIDTLSFEKYQEGKPWNAYKQFCQHFLIPLVLMSYVDIQLGQLSRVYIDGIPLSLANLLLPFHARFNTGIFLHIFLHARAQKYYADKTVDRKLIKTKFDFNSFQGLIESLKSLIIKLTWSPKRSEWSDYYVDSKSYASDAINHKRQLVAEFLERLKPKNVWDLGANIGLFSRIASNKGIQTNSFDMDPACVEINYLTSVEQKEINILPLLLDLTNPSPNIGWENRERMSIFERGPADTVLALALVHHLAIANNLPLHKIADFFKKICQSLIIEFIPKTDKMVQKLLTAREDIFTNYTKERFESEFSKLFTIQTAVRIKGSERLLYLMQKKD